MIGKQSFNALEYSIILLICGIADVVYILCAPACQPFPD